MADKTIPALKILRGKVGINTATPSQQLHVNGEAYIFTGSTSVRTLSGIFKADTIENSAGASNLKLQTESGGNKHIEITPNGTGNVGINTNAPGAKIDVNGSAIFRGANSWAGNDSQGCSIYLSSVGYGVYGNFANHARNLVKANSQYVEVGQNSTLVYGVKFIVGSNAPNGFMFQSNIGGTMTTHMSIRGDTGRVGIGTNAPGDVLHVDGNTIIGDTDRESVVLTLKAQNTAGAPAATTQIRMKGYEGRGIGTFYEDSSYSGQEWFCGMNYSAAFGTWNVGYDASGGQAEYNANTLFRVRYTGRVEMLNYGSGNFTGTAAYKLAVDSSGNIIETAVGSGQVDGSGTANYVTKWTDGDTIGNSSIFDNGSVGIGTNNPSCLLQLGTDGVQGGASLAIRRNGDSINFGHVNGAGYGSVIGCSSNNGYPHIGFMCEAGTNINTFRTRGLKGNVIYTNTSGTLVFGQVTNANADNQSVTARVSIQSDGDAFFYGGNWYCNHNNSSNVTNGGLYINRGGGLYAYALATARSGTGLGGVDFWDYHGVGLVFGPDSSTKVLTIKSNIGIGTTDPGYKLDVYGGDARIGTNLRLGNGSAAGNSTNPAITVSGVNTAGVYFENSGVGFGAGSGSKYLFLSSAGNASLGGNGFFKQLGDRPYGTDNLNDYYRSNDEASFCQFYRYDATHGHWANSSGTLTTNAPSTLTQPTSSIYSYGALFTLRSLSSFRGQFYFAHSASEFYWRSGWGTSSDQNWTRIVGDRNIQTVINNVGTVSIGGASATSGVALSVKGDTEFLDGDTGTRIGLLYDNGTEGILDLRDNNVIKVNLRTAGASYFTGGNVGIGTNAPEAALTVADSTAHQAIFRTAQTTASERAGGGFSSVGSSTATSRYARLFLDADGANFSGTDYFTIEKFGSSGVVKFLQYSNANMSFWVNTSTEALTIWKNGNVGIGTNNPGRELDVDGRILSDSYGFRSDTSVRWYYFDNYSGSNFIGRGGNAYTSLYDGGTLSMAWKAGSVGIGTASPSATLHAVGTVTDNSSAEITRIQGASSSGSTNTHLRFTAASSSSTAANRWFGLQVYDHNPTARALALQHLGGNVGIGTNAPSQKLHVIGAAFIDNTGASGGLTVEASSEARIILQAAQNTAYHAKLSAHYNYTTPMTLSGYGGTVLAQNTGYNKTLLYAANAEQIRITTTGVGIGLGGSDPNAKLEVKSDGSAAGGAEIRLTHDNNNSTDVVSTVNFANNIGSVAMIQGGTTGANNTGYISFFTDSTGTSGERMRIQGNGYVGIGTATAYSPLQVYSSADQKILLSGSANPYIRWQNGGSNRAYIQWVESSNSLSFFNSAGDNFDFYTHDSSVLAIRLKGNDGDNWGYVYAEEGTSQAHAVGFLDGDGAWAARHVKDTSWDFRINNSTKMFIDSNGDVGIGTDNPLSNLHVNYSSGVTDIKAGFLSGTAGPGIRGQNTSTTANTYFPIDFRCNDADARIAFQYSGTSNQGQLLFITEAHSTSPKLGIYDRGTVARVLVNDTTSTGTPTKTFEVKYVSTSTDVTQEGLSGGGVGKGLLIYNTQESNNVYANIDFRARNADGRIAYQYQTATNVGDFHFITDNIGSPQSMMVIKNDGKVGIGTNNPAAHLHINKTSGTTTVLTQVAANSTVGFEIKKTGSTTQHWKIVDGQTINGTLEFYDATDSVTRMAVKGDGNVGVGTANPTSRLDIRSVQAAGDSNGSNLACINLETFNSNSSEYGSYLKCKNYVGGGSGPNWKIGGIEGYWTTNKVASIDFMAGDDWYNPGNKDEGEIAFTVYNNTGSGSTAIEAMRIHQTGNIGIGSTNPGSKLTVNGSFSASSKSFLIDHPTKENKKLEHGCLEGPEFGVYHRGTTQSNTITLPDYWSGLVREDTVTVQLTPRGGFQHLYVVSTSLSQIVIGAADGESIDCFYTIYGERADIDSLVVEKDV